MASRNSSAYFEGLSVRNLLLHPAVWFVVATGFLIFGAVHLWDQHRFQIIAPGQYTINDDNIQVNQPPHWFATDLKPGLRNTVFNSVTLLDNDVVPRTAEYLSGIPWVQRINKISKNPNGLAITLSYRIPVAFVDVAENTTIAVDAEGVLFDLSLLNSLDSSRLENDLLHISMPRVDLTDISPWQMSADERIERASRLCEFLDPVSRELQLHRVVTFDLPSLDPNANPHLEIWTKNGTRIVWGSSPGFETADEANRFGKLSAIRKFIAQNGELEEFPERNIMKIDVHSGSPELIELKRLAEFDDFMEILK